MRCDNEKYESNNLGFCEIPENYLHLDENGVCTNMMYLPHSCDDKETDNQ